ncbi:MULTISPECIES: SCO2521 family protein [Actinokineospora]|uniref:Uncharacterized protein n=1 Tax=Actinokineospora fastidiosa TaxID=1816 RepID=A0A918GEP2_9PSEU|nr:MULTISPECIES: SCO2521 family protein [Actinokineospora]UVS79805.1 hypothetical protein Actkin_03555 [Actinokineospora sp. UTMC 2448]GGS30985.1 hypothetical protein GCM10010171_25970 [Actinokineospora fastidiosa]
MVILGEVRTSLLHNSLPLPRDAVADLLSLRPGRQVTATDRPINRTVSPETVIGVDCAIASEPRVRARGIGTVAAHAVVVGGLVAQASARVRLEWTADRERKPWAHYARRRGVVEVLGGVTAEQVLAGYHRPGRQADTMDLGAVCQRLLTQVQGRPQLDHRTGLRTRPTSLRWTAVAREDERPSVRLHIDDEVQRTLQVVVPPDLLGEAARFCEDLALHDWLYTALGNVVGQAERDMAIGADPMGVLNAALSLLVRLWMPGAHVDLALRPLWQELETTPGFTESWDRQVAWMRDQVSMRTLSALQEARH